MWNETPRTENKLRNIKNCTEGWTTLENKRYQKELSRLRIGHTTVINPHI